MDNIDFPKNLSPRADYINNFKQKFKFEDLSRILNFLKDIKVLCIGDAVIDKYAFVDPKGRALKDPILSTRFEREESYAGGILAVANHLSSYVNKIDMITLIGDQNPELGFIHKALSENVKTRFFVKEKSPTTIKKRYIDDYKKNKLFKVEYMNDAPISEPLSEQITDYLSEELPKYDLVIVLDYDHGFMNEEIRKIIQEKSKFLSVNAQVNSANLGYNYITRYKRADFITLNDLEMRLPLRMRFEDIETVIDKFHEIFGYPKFLVTTGKKGCTFFNGSKKYNSPILTEKVVDTVGAGDSIFAITSLLVHSGFDDELIPFIANCTGGVDANIMGNKEYVDKEKLLNFIGTIYGGVYNGLGRL